MEGICRFADDKEYGPCEGPIMQLNDNAGGTIDCERHARLITAWVEVTRGQKVTYPLHRFWASLDANAMQEFEKKMATVSLDSYIPYVPRLTPRALDAGYAPTPEVAYQPDLLSAASARSKSARRK